MERDPKGPLFLPHLPSGAGSDWPDEQALEQALAELTARARAAWPTIVIADEIFLPYLARRTTPDGDPIDALRRVVAGDLYLACACVLGDGGAVALFRRHHLPRARAALGSMGLPPAQIDDVEQALCVRLLVAEPGGAPQLERYAGRGPLQSWLCIVAVREARLVLRRQQRDPVLSPDALLELIGADAGSELGYLKHAYREEFRAAFDAAVRALSPRERNVLRCHLSGGMTNAQIGALCGVHPGTVKRWMATIRERILDRTREVLMARLGLSPAEVDSLIRLIRSDIDVSIDLMIETEAHAPGP